VPPRAATNAYDASLQLLACLTVAVQAAENPPANIQFLPGQQAGEDISIYEDLCCEGTAFIRVATLYPSSQQFPAPDTEAIPCQLQGMALNYEMGIMRCSPVGDAAQVPTSAAWLAAHRQSMIDAQSLYTAACCYKGQYDLDAMLIGPWAPLGPQGGCLMGSITLTHSIIGNCRVC
jgi:hypothetical protein